MHPSRYHLWLFSLQLNWKFLHLQGLHDHSPHTLHQHHPTYLQSHTGHIFLILSKHFPWFLVFLLHVCNSSPRSISLSTPPSLSLPQPPPFLSFPHLKSFHGVFMDWCKPGYGSLYFSIWFPGSNFLQSCWMRRLIKITSNCGAGKIYFSLSWAFSFTATE